MRSNKEKSQTEGTGKEETVDKISKTSESKKKKSGWRTLKAGTRKKNWGTRLNTTRKDSTHWRTQT